jgi:hypothetical protein
MKEDLGSKYISKNSNIYEINQNAKAQFKIAQNINNK